MIISQPINYSILIVRIALKSKKIMSKINKIRHLAEIQQSRFVDIDKSQKYVILLCRECLIFRIFSEMERNK